MENFSDANWWGVILPLDELQARLRSISDGPHQWTANLEHEVRNEWQTRRQFSVRIQYTNPEFEDMPNDISYLFPAIVDSLFWQPNVLVCLHPSLAVPMVKGLYFERDQLKYDLLEDWDRFWTPMRKSLPWSLREPRNTESQ